ncbi:peptidoglycan editing factor PgeF [Neobacillus sp. PS3-12]|jgi:polyphenol oxidase|uniref:peptidoglycan editing factor PgeF n=1 Tax=Neobacillus sp. PS3-12 TaxID=3070677 RepID=UPI0027DF282A|nr:peptidoglycan editing factor PgeF [Neobacillus sp. PS3-12]WML51931.1 peptidoglycan editing factor PgeF [Neobacillus sp. PS3-12]
MEPFVLQQESLFLIKNWTDQYKNLVAGMTTKNEGYSKEAFNSLNLGFHVGDVLIDVCTNRQKVAEDVGFPLEHWVGAEQIHEKQIQKVTRADRGRGSNLYDTSFKGTDGFYTDEKGILLTLCYADCVPLFFIAPEWGMIGAAHAGWKGTVKQIAAEMVELWGMEGIRPQQIFVTIGPSICKKCYIVDKRVIDLVQNILVDVEEKPYNLVKENEYCLDLREVNRLVLQKAGVPNENISSTGYCTSCDQDKFFSHRRDHGRTGRMLSFIGWKEDSCF